MLQQCLNLIFPPFCASCDRIGHQLCIRHLNDICWNYTPTYNDWIFSATEYKDSTRDIVTLVKYRFAYRYVALMAQLIALRFPDFPQKQKIDALIPVPLHRRRQRWRGFNQAQLLAEHLGKIWNISVDSHSLRRETHSRSQASQNKEDRQKVVTAFKLIKPLTYQRACLIDDVVTTGSTLSACREALGTTPTIALTFAREL